MAEEQKTSPKSAYPRTRRDDCVCNICGQNVPKLSDDHVPPKGTFRPGTIRVHCYPESHQGETHRVHISHNGLKFRTICPSCNNNLGAMYDVHLKHFLNRLSAVLSLPLILSNPLMIRGRPTAIIKAVMGHILAAKTDVCNGDADKATRAYLFNEDAVLANNIRLFCWYYPYGGTIISTDRIDVDLINGGSVWYSVLKYYPLAFLLMSNGNGMSDPNVTELTKYNHDNEQEEIDLPIYLHQFPIDYPEGNAHNKHMARLVYDGRTDILTESIDSGPKKCV